MRCEIATHLKLRVHFCTRCGHFGPPGGKSPGLRIKCKPPSKTGKQALRNIRKGRWPTYKGKIKGRQYASPRLCLGRFAALLRRRRLRAALGEVAAMPAPSFSMSRPKRSCDPGPSIPDAPGRCPLHQGQLGWNMLLPCEACIALAFVPAEVPSSANSVGVEQTFSANSPQKIAVPSGVPLNSYAPGIVGAASGGPSVLALVPGAAPIFPGVATQANSHAVKQHPAAPRLASSVLLERPSQGSDGVPPPPPPIACFRHRDGRGWSLSDPCEACLQLAFDADLGLV